MYLLTYLHAPLHAVWAYLTSWMHDSCTSLRHIPPPAKLPTDRRSVAGQKLRQLSTWAGHHMLPVQRRWRILTAAAVDEWCVNRRRDRLVARGSMRTEWRRRRPLSTQQACTAPYAHRADVLVQLRLPSASSPAQSLRETTLHWPLFCNAYCKAMPVCQFCQANISKQKPMKAVITNDH